MRKKKPDYIEETKIDEKADIAPVTTFKLGYYLKNPTVLFTAFAFFAYNYILFFFLTWFPSYLVDARNLSIENMSLITVIPWVLGFLGLAMSGIVSDFVYKHTVQKVCFSLEKLFWLFVYSFQLCVSVFQE